MFATRFANCVLLYGRASCFEQISRSRKWFCWYHGRLNRQDKICSQYHEQWHAILCGNKTATGNDHRPWCNNPKRFKEGKQIYSIWIKTFWKNHQKKPSATFSKCTEQHRFPFRAIWHLFLLFNDPKYNHIRSFQYFCIAIRTFSYGNYD